MIDVWQEGLYAPLLNFLIALYNGPAFGSLGMAVIYLTIILRLFLMPFTILSERSKGRYEAIHEQINTLEHDFKNDAVQKKEMIRNVLREHQISPWSKAIVLGIQGLVLIVIYQVFLGGINYKLTKLYSWVDYPDFINTSFLGLDLGERSLFAAFLVAAFLFLEIYLDYRQSKEPLSKSDVFYQIFFPLGVFLILSILPSVKALFIITSLFFSLVVTIIRKKYFNFRINIKIEKSS